MKHTRKQLEQRINTRKTFEGMLQVWKDCEAEGYVWATFADKTGKSRIFVTQREAEEERTRELPNANMKELYAGKIGGGIFDIPALIKWSQINIDLGRSAQEVQQLIEKAKLKASDYEQAMKKVQVGQLPDAKIKRKRK